MMRRTGTGGIFSGTPRPRAKPPQRLPNDDLRRCSVAVLVRALSAILLACVLLACGGAGALASARPCSAACDVPVGTYQGTNHQGKPVLVDVAEGHLKSGPH